MKRSLDVLIDGSRKSIPSLINLLPINGMKWSIHSRIEIVDPSSHLEGDFFPLSRKSLEKTFSVLRLEKSLRMLFVFGRFRLLIRTTNGIFSRSNISIQWHFRSIWIEFFLSVELIGFVWFSLWSDWGWAMDDRGSTQMSGEDCLPLEFVFRSEWRFFFQEDDKDLPLSSGRNGSSFSREEKGQSTAQQGIAMILDKFAHRLADRLHSICQRSNEEDFTESTDTSFASSRDHFCPFDGREVVGNPFLLPTRNFFLWIHSIDWLTKKKIEHIHRLSWLRTLDWSTMIDDMEIFFNVSKMIKLRFASGRKGRKQYSTLDSLQRSMMGGGEHCCSPPLRLAEEDDRLNQRNEWKCLRQCEIVHSHEKYPKEYLIDWTIPWWKNLPEHLIGMNGNKSVHHRVKKITFDGSESISIQMGGSLFFPSQLKWCQSFANWQKMEGGDFTFAHFHRFSFHRIVSINDWTTLTSIKRQLPFQGSLHPIDMQLVEQSLTQRSIFFVDQFPSSNVAHPSMPRSIFWICPMGWPSRWRMFVCTNSSPLLRQPRSDQDRGEKTLPRLHSIPSFIAGWPHLAPDTQRLGGRDTRLLKGESTNSGWRTSVLELSNSWTMLLNVRTVVNIMELNPEYGSIGSLLGQRLVDQWNEHPAWGQLTSRDAVVNTSNMPRANISPSRLRLSIGWTNTAD